MPTPKQAVSKTKTKTKPKPTVMIEQKELPMQLLSPEEFEAITKANYYHPESQLILKLFLHISHFWNITRQMQGKPTDLPKPVVEWERVEQSASKLIEETLKQLLSGVSVTPWVSAKSNGRTHK